MVHIRDDFFMMHDFPPPLMTVEVIEPVPVFVGNSTVNLRATIFEEIFFVEITTIFG